MLRAKIAFSWTDLIQASKMSFVRFKIDVLQWIAIDLNLGFFF